jgi:hypothetical protein
LFATRCATSSTSRSRTWASGSYVDPVAIDIAAVLDDVAEIDPHAELDALVGRHVDVSLRHLALHLDGAAHCIDNTRELDEEAVAGGLDNAARGGVKLTERAVSRR